MPSVFSHKQAVVDVAVTTDVATSKTITFGSTPTAGDFLVVAVTSNVSTNTQVLSDGAGGTWVKYVTYLSATSTQFLTLWGRVVGPSESWANLNVVMTLNGGSGTNSWSGTMTLVEYTGFVGTPTVEGAAAATASQSSNSSGLTVIVPQFINGGTHLIVGFGVRSSASGGSAQFTDIPTGSTGAGTPGAMTVTRQGASSTLYEAYSDGINLSGGNSVAWAWGSGIKSLSAVLAIADVVSGGTVTVTGARAFVRTHARPGTINISETVTGARAFVRTRARPGTIVVTQASLSAIFGVAVFGDYATFGNATTGLIVVSGTRAAVRVRALPGTILLSGLATMNATAGMAAVGTEVVPAAGTFTATASMSATGGVTLLASATFGATAAMVSTGTQAPSQTGAATFGVVASMTAAAVLTQQAGATMGAQAAMTASPSLVNAAGGTIAVSGSLAPVWSLGSLGPA